MNEELKRDLIDDDGENRAVRSFLMQYSCDRSITVGQMRQHMARSGWGATYCPPFVNNSTATAGEHLTKSGAQIWIRHLIGLERRTPVSGEVAEESDGAMYARMSAAAAPDDLKAAAEQALEIAAAQPAADHACPRDTPYGPAICGECVDDHAKQADGADAFGFAVMEHLGPDVLTGGKMTPYRAFELGWQARGQQAGAAIPGEAK